MHGSHRVCVSSFVSGQRMEVQVTEGTESHWQTDTRWACYDSKYACCLPVGTFATEIKMKSSDQPTTWCHKINSHKINYHQINSHDFNLSRNHESWSGGNWSHERKPNQLTFKIKLKDQLNAVVTIWTSLIPTPFHCTARGGQWEESMET